MKNYLNFETDIKELETEIEKLKDPFNQSGVSEVDTQKISKIQSDLDEKLEMIYSNLDPWQTTMVARHEDRPKSKFFIDNLFEDFISLEGDRYYGEDKSVITGLARISAALGWLPYMRISAAHMQMQMDMVGGRARAHGHAGGHGDMETWREDMQMQVNMS